MIRFIQTAETFFDIEKAREAVLRFAKTATLQERKKADLLFDNGEYCLTKPLIFDANEEPALLNIELSLCCENGTATFTSNRALDFDRMQKTENGYVYQFEKDESGKYPLFHDVYEEFDRMPIAASAHGIHAFPFSEENKRINETNLEGIYVPEEMAEKLPNGDLFPLELMIYVEWEFHVLHVLCVDRDRIKIDEKGNRHVLLRIVPEELFDYVKGVNRVLQPKNRECFFRNHPIFLQENTWCYDHKKGVLHFSPKFDLHEKIFVPTLEKLLVFKGMNGITLRGLTFTGITDKFLPENGFLSDQATVEKRSKKKVSEAALLTENVRALSVENCEFKQLGTNGILMLGTSAMVNIHDNYFHDIAMSAVSIGDPMRVTNDKKNCSYDVHIENNFVSRIGYDFPAAPALQVFRVDGLLLSHNTIDRCAYSAVSVGWEWVSLPYALGEMINIRDAEISYNKITNHMQLLRDGGAVYVVGANSMRTNTKRYNKIHHNFACNDRILRKSRGYYLDGSSTGWDVYENVTAKVHYPVFAQYHVGEQFVWHNRIDETYSTEEISLDNHHPERDTLLGATYIEPTLDALLEKYPKARRIMEESGILDIKPKTE